MKKSFVLFLCLIAFGLTSSRAQEGLQELPFDTAVVRGVLPNGLTYYIQHNNNPRQRAFFYIAQKVGSVQEDDSQRGLAHFLEHMCFNGSQHFAGNGIINYCERIGVRFGEDLNAYTAADRTVYNINNVPTTDPTNIDSCLYILYDWSNALTLDSKEIDKERGVIHEEWRMRSSAFMRVLERQMPTLMPGSRYGERLPIGLMSVVDNFKPEVLRAYYKKWYRPDLQGIIIVGDIDVKQVEEKVKAIFGGIKMPENPAKFEYYPVPNNDKPIVVVDKDKEQETPMIDLMFKHEVMPREMRNTISGVAYDYLLSMMQRMFNYRLEDLMQSPTSPFSSISMSNDEFILATTKEALMLEITPKEGKSSEAFSDALREVVRAVRYGFTAPEYERAQKQFESDLDQAVEAHKKVKSDPLAQECIRHFLDNQAKPSFVDEINIDKQLTKLIPLESVNEAFKNIIGKIDTNVVVAAIYPDKEGYAVPEKATFEQLLASGRVEDVKPYVAKTVETKLVAKNPKAGSIVKVLPADALGYKTLVLSNGIKVHYKYTDFDESTIHFSAVSKGGMSKLPLKDMNNAQMFNSVMAGNGLGRFNSNELSKALTGRQVTLTPSLAQIEEALRGTTSKKDIRTLMQLVYLYFTDVNYDTINYRNVYKQTEQDLKNRDANPQNALQDSAVVRIFANNPRQQPLTLRRLQGVSYDEILRIYKQRFANPGDFQFIFTGMISEDSIKELSKLYLASLPVKGKPETFTDLGIDYWKGMQECRIVRKMETPMAILIQLWNGNAPRTIKNQVVASAFGKVMEMMYLATIREEYSLAYSVNSGCSIPYDIKSEFLSETDCPVKPEKCDSALMLIDTGLKQVVAHGPEDKYLSKVKEQMLKNLENSQRDNGYWHSAEYGILMYGYNPNVGFKEAIQNLTAADVQQFARDFVMKQGNRLNLMLLPKQ